jgi:hypothetical protein
MPGGHSENTSLLGFYADRDLVHLVDQARKKKKKDGTVPRSQFLRDAIVEYLLSKKVDVPPHLRSAPDRAGKGGPTKYPKHKREKPPAQCTGTISSAVASAKSL